MEEMDSITGIAMHLAGLEGFYRLRFPDNDTLHDFDLEDANRRVAALELAVGGITLPAPSERGSWNGLTWRLWRISPGSPNPSHDRQITGVRSPAGMPGMVDADAVDVSSIRRAAENLTPDLPPLRCSLPYRACEKCWNAAVQKLAYAGGRKGFLMSSDPLTKRSIWVFAATVTFAAVCTANYYPAAAQQQQQQPPHGPWPPPSMAYPRNWNGPEFFPSPQFREVMPEWSRNSSKSPDHASKNHTREPADRRHSRGSVTIGSPSGTLDSFIRKSKDHQNSPQRGDGPGRNNPSGTSDGQPSAQGPELNLYDAQEPAFDRGIPHEATPKQSKSPRPASNYHTLHGGASDHIDRSGDSSDEGDSQGASLHQSSPQGTACCRSNSQRSASNQNRGPGYPGVVDASCQIADQPVAADNASISADEPVLNSVPSQVGDSNYDPLPTDDYHRRARARSRASAGAAGHTQVGGVGPASPLTPSYSPPANADLLCSRTGRVVGSCTCQSTESPLVSTLAPPGTGEPKRECRSRQFLRKIQEGRSNSTATKK